MLWFERLYHPPVLFVDHLGVERPEFVQHRLLLLDGQVRQRRGEEHLVPFFAVVGSVSVNSQVHRDVDERGVDPLCLLDVVLRLFLDHARCSEDDDVKACIAVVCIIRSRVLKCNSV